MNKILCKIFVPRQQILNTITINLNRFNVIKMNKMSTNNCWNDKTIAEFYSDSNVFVTGTTGFVGKCLIEKLLRTTSLDTIYILIRSKRGKTIDERLKDILNDTAFDRIRKESPDYLRKIRPIEGDVDKPNLGMNKDDANLLIDKVNVVFHSAASIRFNDQLSNALRTNTYGTYQIVQFATKMKRIKGFVYVSTAYCNVDKREIGEIVYKPNFKPMEMLNLLANDPKSLDKRESTYIKNHPNTYTFSKLLAENLLLDYVGKLPITIVRPSIVTCAWKDPFPGWFFGENLINFFILETYKGNINTLLCKKDVTVDLIPIDLLTNTLIASVWLTDLLKFDKVKVYHCTTGLMNRIDCDTLKNYLEGFNVNSKVKTTLSADVSLTSRQAIHKVHWFFSRTIPAAFHDIGSIARNEEPKLLVASCFAERVWQAMNYFTRNEWIFHDDNTRFLQKVIDRRNGDDAATFNVSMRDEDGFVWYDYLKNYVANIKKHYGIENGTSDVQKEQEEDKKKN